MQNAIDREDLKLLSEAIYEIKMNRDCYEGAFSAMEPSRKSLQSSDQSNASKERNELNKIKSDLKK